MVDFQMDFQQSVPFTIGVELELQVIDINDCDLTSSAGALLEAMECSDVPGSLSPEITDSMIEVSVGVCESWIDIRNRLALIRDSLVEVANDLQIGIAGGGSHPFQQWQQRQIFDTDRFQRVSTLYGYLAKQFTVFGQHVHIGCETGDQAMWLLQSLHRFVPHFIAFSGSSPFFQGAITSFQSSRLCSISPFPYSGIAPFYLNWDQFVSEHYIPLWKVGGIKSMKDFYWDVRPKPEYGTVEVRVADTPLSVDRAALLAGFIQLICRRLVLDRIPVKQDETLVYSFNRFQASRFGFGGEYVDPLTRKNMNLRDSMFKVLSWLEPLAKNDPDTRLLLNSLKVAVRQPTDAERLLAQYQLYGNLEDTVRYSIRSWSGNPSASKFLAG
jgi:glutamate---cysteine ligase / carboxylate-amine ligase